MNIVFCVDSSTAIGTGHLIRCRTLAEELRRRDVNVQFICRDLPGNLIALLSQSEFPVTVLPRPANLEAVTDPENYAAWLGVTQEVDAAETIAALASRDWDWLIVDHYGLDRRWEVLLRPHVKRVLAIDDLANRSHDCDVLLDQNESIEGEARYHGLVPENCHLLIGCRYALLRPEYAAYRQTQPPRTGEVQRVFVFFGGTDPQNMTGQALAALSVPEFEALSVDVVVGANYPYRAELERQVANRPQTLLYDPRPHLADLMARADLAIGAGGTTTWERCCLGLPTIVVSVAKNQVSACQALEKKGAIVYLGTAEAVDIAGLQKAIAQLLPKSSYLLISAQSQNQVDGLGAKRVAEMLG
jgi:UDP-2,4-diacetamido-2,4,6-trideoxy-beta-L-altropyranose hydrolase